MKKLFSLTFMLFFTAVLLSACSKKDKEVDPNSSGSGYSNGGATTKPTKK